MTPFIARVARTLVLAAMMGVCVSCQLIGNATRVGTRIGVATGALDEERAAEINQQADTLAQSFRDITPEQEYYVGRSVAAVVFDTYQPLESAEANEYVNVLGQTVALASQRPFTFGGYRFLILDSKEINGLAAPGGLVFVTRGLINLARTEDELAAILAHEIAHIELKHGLQAIKRSRITNALTDIVVSAGENSRVNRIAEISQEFGDSVKDITAALVNNGYSRSSETQADAAAVSMLVNLGYDPAGLIRVLRRMNLRLLFSRAGFARTHPRPGRRISGIRQEIRGYDEFEPNPVPGERRTRFRRAMRALRRAS